MGRKLAGIAFGLLTVLMVALCWPPPREMSTTPPTAAAVTEGADPSHRAAAPSPSVAAPVAPPLQRAPADATTVVTLRGRVRDDRGPVAGASVQWFAEPRGPDDAPAGSATTDAAGQFRGEARLGAERKFVAIATAEGHQETSVSGVAGTREVLIRMARWVTISGCVREHGSGVPIEGATVTDQQHSAVTDARGRYTLQASVMMRQALLTAHAAGYAKETAEVRSLATVVDHDFDLHRRIALTCMVVDRETGAPIADATLADTYTEPDGTCRIEVAGSGATVLVDATGYVPLQWTWRAADAPTKVVRLPLAHAASITGRVVGDAGQGVAGAAVYVSHAAWALGERTLAPEQSAHWELPGTAVERQPAAARTLSGSDGQFALEVAADPAPYSLHARHDAWVATTPSPVTVALGGDRAHVELRLTAAGTVVGRVTQGGQPLRRSVQWNSTESDARGSAFCDDAGSYRIQGVAPGRVTVAVREVAGPSIGEATIDVVAGQETRCDFALAELAGTIRGRVTTADGKPRSGCSVRAGAVHEGAARSFYATTDDAGDYVLRCALQVKYTVMVNENEFVATHDGVAAPATGIDFTIPEFGLLRLQLVDAATGAPLRNVSDHFSTVAWRPSGTPALRVARGNVDSNGRVELRLPQGRVDVSVALPRSGFARRLVVDLAVTDAAEPPVIPIAMPRGVTWEVAVVGAPFSGETLGTSVVFLLAAEQFAMVRDPTTKPGVEPNERFDGVKLWIEDPQLVKQRLVFDDRGVATLPGLAPGRYTLRAFPDQLAFEPGTIEVGAQDGRSELTPRRR